MVTQRVAFGELARFQVDCTQLHPPEIRAFSFVALLNRRWCALVRLLAGLHLASPFSICRLGSPILGHLHRNAPTL